MYSVSQGLNSGTTTALALSTSADLALRRSALCVWIWRSTSRLVLARRADSWIYQDNKHNCQSLWTLTVTWRSGAKDREITSLVEAAGPTLCVFLLAMSASFSPEPYRAKGCLLSLLSSLGCRVAAGLTRWERQKCLEDLGGLLSCGPPVSPSKNNHTKSLIHFDKIKSKSNQIKRWMDSFISLVPITDSVFRSQGVDRGEFS